MAESLEPSYDLERTIVVWNFPKDVGEDELTIHFQKEKNGGGDVDEAVVDGSVAFVIFDLPEVVTSVIKHPEQVINKTKIEVQSYESWLANKKKKHRPSAGSPKNDLKDSPPEDIVSEDAIKTIYVSDLKDSTSTDAITFFFENKRRTGGGDLREGKEGFKRLSPTVARLTFVSSKDAKNVLEKAKVTPFQLEGNFLTVSSEFIPTHDQSILLAKNLNPKTSKETFKNFVESTKKADVFNVVFGKDHKAIVILKSTIDADEDDSEKENIIRKLDGSIISLEFAPLTKGIKISNIPRDTSCDDVKFKFSNPNIGGGTVTDIMLDRNNGVASVYFEKSSVVSDLVKNHHTLKNVPLTLIPYYDDFEELQETKTKTDYFGDHLLDRELMYYIMSTQEIDKKFDFKTFKFDEETSRFYFTKQFDDPKYAIVFKNKVKDFFLMFDKDDVKIPKYAFDKVKEEIESKRDEFEEDKVEFNFGGSRVTLVGKKEDVAVKKKSIEAAIDRILEEAQFVPADLTIDDRNKLKFLNFINYFQNVMTEFPGVKIHGIDGTSGKLSLWGTAEKIKDVQLKIYQDISKICEIAVKTSDHQINFLKRTECKTVNDELKKNAAMLLLIDIEGAVGVKVIQAKILTLKKCDDKQKKRLLNLVDAETSEKCITVDKESATFLSQSSKLQEFKKKQFEKHHVLIHPELTDPRNIWIVCEKSKMYNAEQELANLIDKNKISSYTPGFPREHCWGKIWEKEKSDKPEDFVVWNIDTNSFERKGTKTRRKEMNIVPKELTGTGDFRKKFHPLVDRPLYRHSEDAVTTIYVSNLKDSTTTGAITYFFENKKRSGGGDLREGKEGFKRLSPTVARLTFVSSQDAKNVLEKAKVTPLQLEGNFLTVSSEFIPTHDQSILLAKNLNPKTSKQTFKNFVESTKNADVFNVVFGKDHKAIVILKSTIDADEDDSERENADIKLEGSIISLEFAPLTKGIKISNIPQDTSSDDVKFKFSNPNIGGGKVTDIMLDRNNGVASVYFEKSSVVSDLVKNHHTLKKVPLTLIPYYDDFEELQETKTKASDYFGDHLLDRELMYYIMSTQEIDKKFDFKTFKFDEETSRFYFTKQFDDPKYAIVFKNKVKDFFLMFDKDDVKIPKYAFDKVKEEIESKRDEFEEDKVEFNFGGSRVTLVGKKEDVAVKKKSIEAAIDRILEEAQFADLTIDDRNKLKVLNFINYFQNVMTEIPGVKIHGIDGTSGKLSLWGTAEKIKDVQLKIYADISKISEITVKTSDHQIDFLKRTGCKTVNDELKKDDAMLLLIDIEGAVGVKALQAKIMTLKKCDDNQKKRLLKIFDLTASEKCITVDEETASFLSKLNKLQELKKEQFDKHQVWINPELTDPRNIWVVCEKSKISKAELKLTCLIHKNTIGSSTFKPKDGMKVRFLKEHRWDKIKEKERIYKDEGVVVRNDNLEVKGTKKGRVDMIMFLEGLAANVDCKTYLLNEPGMKKQMSMDTTDAIISEVEKNHTCVIQKGVPSEKTEKEAKVPTLGAVGRNAVGTSPASTMNLPYYSMAFVNDKEVKLASGQRITIVIGDLAQQRVEVIVNTTNCKLDLNANSCGRAILKVAGKELLNECQKIGSLQPGNITSTGPAKLNCQRVYHVRASQWNNGKGALILSSLVRKCFDQMEKDRLKSIAIPAIGTGNLRFPRQEVSKVFFEEVTKYFTDHPWSIIDDVRFVVFGGDQATVGAFLDSVQEIKSMILPSQSIRPDRLTKSPAGVTGLSIKIYCDDGGRIEKAGVELMRKMKTNIREKIIQDSFIKRFTDRDLEKLRKLERDCDVKIHVYQSEGEIKIKGHIADIPNIQEEIRNILKDIAEKEPKVPAHWVKTTDERKYYKYKLPTYNQEYKDVEAAFRATARNEIVSIERIQNEEIYESYNVKRKRMMKKYGSNSPGKEKMLFHGTSRQNLEKINTDGLNRAYAGTHAKHYGSGVYFARDASYSCKEIYSPPDPQGFRYMYYARVLVGDYTRGQRDMKVRPPKNSADPNETYDSVVDNVANPTIFVLFQDYEYYTEYLITFK